MFFQLSMNNMEKRVVSNFKSELEILAEEVHYKVLIAQQRVQALSSRTMIRNELYSYHNGEISLEEVQNYTQPKYSDGVEVYDNVLLAVRTDLKGTVIAKCGGNVIQSEYEYKDSTIDFLSSENGYNLLIRNKIVHKSSPIGYDTVVFKLNDIAKTKSAYLSGIQVITSHKSNDNLREYAFSVPLEDTNYFFHAKLKQSIVVEEQNTIRSQVLLLSALLIAAVLIVSYFTIFRLTFHLIKLRDELNAKLQQSLKYKDYLLKELNHRVKNNLNMVTSLINLKDSEIEPDISDIQHQIKAISLVHEKLHQQNDVERIEVKQYFQELLESVFSFTANRKIHIVNNIENVSIPTKTAIPLGLVVNEIATNAIKYGYTADEEGSFTMEFKQDEEHHQYFLTLSNTGNPFPQEVDIDNTNTLGLKLINSLVEQLDGTIELQKEPNPVFTIRFPIGED